MPLSTINSNSFSTTANTNIDSGTLFIDVINNRIGMGTTAPVAPHHIKGSGTSGQTTSALILENASSGTLGLDITGTAGSSYARLRYGGGPGTGTNAMTGDVALIGLEGSSIGFQQIKFAPTQVASSDPNTLDDYEEGTWTPTLGGNTTYTAQVGAYTKIGRLVVATFEVNVSSIGTGATTSISGLPFTSFGSPTNGMGGMVGYFTGGANSVVMITLRIDLGATTISVASIASASTGMNAGLAFFTNNTRILGTIVYMTA
jgi:hypothetical protein